MKIIPFHLRILIALSLISNVCGFIFRLFIADGPYDEIAHVFTPFVISYLLYTLAVQRFKQLDITNSIPLLMVVASVTISLCVAWEVAEWAVFKFWPSDPTHDLDDTITDLIYGGIGASSITLVAHIKQQLARLRSQKRTSWNLNPQQTFEQILKQNETTY